MQHGAIYSLVVSDSVSGKGWEITDLNMSFDVMKTSDSATSQSNHATVRVWNLSRDKQVVLEKGKAQVILKVGYQPIGLTFLFSGEVVLVQTRKEGPEVITEFKVTPSFTELSATRISQTIPAGKKVRDVVNAVVAKVPTIKKTVAEGDYLDKELPDGYSMLGSPFSILNELAKTYKLEWNIDGNTLYISDVGKSWELRPEKAYVINQTTGLIDRPYKSSDESSSNTSNKGVTFRCLLNPKIKAGGIIRLEYEGFTDFYKVDSLRHSGTFLQAGTWITEVSCSRYLPQGLTRWTILLRPDKAGLNVSTSNAV